MSWQGLFGLFEGGPTAASPLPPPVSLDCRSSSTNPLQDSPSPRSQSPGIAREGSHTNPAEEAGFKIQPREGDHNRDLSDTESVSFADECAEGRDEEETKRREARALRRQRIRIVLSQGVESQVELRRSNPELVASPRDIEWVSTWRTRQLQHLTSKASSAQACDSSLQHQDFGKSFSFHGVPTRYTRQEGMSGRSPVGSPLSRLGSPSRHRRSHSTVDSSRSADLGLGRSSSFHTTPEAPGSYSKSYTLHGPRQRRPCFSPDSSSSPLSGQASGRREGVGPMPPDTAWQGLGRAQSLGCPQASDSPLCRTSSFAKSKSHPPPMPSVDGYTLAGGSFHPSCCSYSFRGEQSLGECCLFRGELSSKVTSNHVAQSARSSRDDVQAPEKTRVLGGDGQSLHYTSRSFRRRSPLGGSPNSSPLRASFGIRNKSPLGVSSGTSLSKSESFHGVTGGSTPAGLEGGAENGDRLLLSHNLEGTEGSPENAARVGTRLGPGMLSPRSPVGGVQGRREVHGFRGLSSPRLAKEPCPAPRSPSHHHGQRRSGSRMSSFSVDFDATGFASLA